MLSSPWVSPVTMCHAFHRFHQSPKLAILSACSILRTVALLRVNGPNPLAHRLIIGFDRRVSVVAECLANYCNARYTGVSLVSQCTSFVFVKIASSCIRVVKRPLLVDDSDLVRATSVLLPKRERRQLSLPLCSLSTTLLN